MDFFRGLNKEQWTALSASAVCAIMLLFGFSGGIAPATEALPSGAEEPYEPVKQRHVELRATHGEIEGRVRLRAHDRAGRRLHDDAANPVERERPVQVLAQLGQPPQHAPPDATAARLLAGMRRIEESNPGAAPCERIRGPGPGGSGANDGDVCRINHCLFGSRLRALGSRPEVRSPKRNRSSSRKRRVRRVSRRSSP